MSMTFCLGTGPSTLTTPLTVPAKAASGPIINASAAVQTCFVCIRISWAKISLLVTAAGRLALVLLGRRVILRRSSRQSDVWNLPARRLQYFPLARGTRDLKGTEVVNQVPCLVGFDVVGE